MADPFNNLVTGSWANTLMAGGELMSRGQSRRDAYRELLAQRDQNMFQFNMQQSVQDRAAQEQSRQFGLQQNSADRAFIAQREESAFARLNSVLDRQLQVAEMESKERQQAFQNTLQMQLFESQLQRDNAAVQQIDMQTERMRRMVTAEKELPKFDLLATKFMSGDTKSRILAASEISAWMEKNAELIGVAPPAMRENISIVSQAAAGFSSPFFKVLKDNNPSILPDDVLGLAKNVDPDNGLDVDEAQILSTVLEGFKFAAPTSDVAGRQRELKAHLDKKFSGGPEGSVVAEHMVSSLFKDANSQSKFFESVDRGTFMRPLSSDEVQQVKLFRSQLQDATMKLMLEIREQGWSSGDAAQFLAAHKAADDNALESFAYGLKGARDPEGVSFLKGSNVVTVDSMEKTITQAPVIEGPGAEVRRRGAKMFMLSQGPLAPVVAENMALVQKGATWYSKEALRADLGRFKQEYVQAIRLDPSLLGDQTFMNNWSLAQQKIVDHWGDKFSANVINDQLSFSRHVPNWLVQDRSLLPIARRNVQGYFDPTTSTWSAESPTAAITGSLLMSYGARQRGAAQTLTEMTGAALLPAGAEAAGRPALKDIFTSTTKP